MLTRIEVTYTIEGIEPKTEVITTPEIRDYIEEYVVIVHKMLAEILKVDPKDVKILEWRYLGRE